jgi:serine/threonine protein phosphatase PrpC
MLWVSQFGIAGGQTREETPWVGAYPDAHSEDSCDLYLLVEPATPGSEEFCAELKDALAAVFYKWRGSITGGLLSALRAAHEDLRDWNRRSMKDHHVAAGLSCLAVRPGGPPHEAYLAQVGPAAAVAFRNDALTAVRPTLPDSLEPLGLFDEFRPDFSHHELEEGGRLLLLSPGLLDALSLEQLSAPLSSAPEDVLPSLYLQARSLPNCAALLVAAVPGPPAPPA